MANHAYLRVWTRDFSVETMLAEFARFLTTAPLSAAQNAFTELIVQAVDATEIPVAEWDLRPLKVGPAEVTALAVQHLNADTAYIVNATWDLWSFDIESLKWQHKTGAAPANLPRAWNMMVDLLRVQDTSWRTWASNIFSPGMAGFSPPALRRIHLTPRIIPWNTPSGSGWRQVGT